MEEAAAKAGLEELRRKKTQSDLQDRYRLDLEREKMVTFLLCLLCSYGDTLKRYKCVQETQLSSFLASG